jgi:hypothetical protein
VVASDKDVVCKRSAGKPIKKTLQILPGTMGSYVSRVHKYIALREIHGLMFAVRITDANQSHGANPTLPCQHVVT